MTSMPTNDGLALNATPAAGPDQDAGNPQWQSMLDSVGLAAALDDVTKPGFERVTAHLTEPMATTSRAAYAAWLRRQASAWGRLSLPAVPVAALDWPLASVRPQCLDVVGLLLADLRELSPRTRPTLVPLQATSPERPQPGAVIGSVDVCVRLAGPPAALLERALTLTAGMTRMGSATRYLARCADLADRASGLAREVDQWATVAGSDQTHLALLTAQRLVEHLADGLEARVRTGW